MTVNPPTGRRVRARLAAVFGASLLATLVLAGPVAATHVAPELIEGNPVCSGEGGPSGPSLGFANPGVKIDPPAEGTFDVGDGTVTISDIDNSVNPATFTWTSHDVVVLAVIVKGGPNANVYRYNPPPTTADDGLHAPNGFSHIEICWQDPTPPPTGSLKVTKVVTGGTSDATFTIHVDCGEAFEDDVTLKAGESFTKADLPVGTECTVTEPDQPAPPDGFDWNDAQIDGSPATIEADSTVTVTVTNPLEEIPETPTLVIEKSNDAPGVSGSDEGDTVNYTLDYTLTNGPVDNGVIEDVLPVGVTYVDGSASSNDEFTFVSYTAATRTLRWEADQVTKDGSLTYQATIDEGAAELQQPLTNTACISSDQTDQDCDDSDVFVGPPPQAETSVPNTAPPTDTVAGDQTSASGSSMLLILMALAGIALAVVFIAPTPASIRKRMR